MEAINLLDWRWRCCCRCRWRWYRLDIEFILLLTGRGCIQSLHIYFGDFFRHVMVIGFSWISILIVNSAGNVAIVAIVVILFELLLFDMLTLRERFICFLNGFNRCILLHALFFDIRILFLAFKVFIIIAE